MHLILFALHLIALSTLSASVDVPNAVEDFVSTIPDDVKNSYASLEAEFLNHGIAQKYSDVFAVIKDPQIVKFEPNSSCEEDECKSKSNSNIAWMIRKMKRCKDDEFVDVPNRRPHLSWGAVRAYGRFDTYSDAEVRECLHAAHKKITDECIAKIDGGISNKCFVLSFACGLGYDTDELRRPVPTRGRALAARVLVKGNY